MMILNSIPVQPPSLSNSDKILAAIQTVYLQIYLSDKRHYFADTRVTPINVIDEISTVYGQICPDYQTLTVMMCNTLMFAIGNCFAAANSALDNKFGKDKFNGQPVNDANIQALRIIVGAARNAFTHDPAEPKWEISSPTSPYNNLWSFTTPSGKHTVTVDLRGMHGKILRLIDFGGFEKFLVILHYTRQVVQ